MRLEELERRLGDRVSVEWRSFLLRPVPEARPMEDFTAYTESWARPSGMAPEAGFAHPWSGENPPPNGSLSSSIAGKVAESFGAEAWEAFHKGLLAAYFTEHRTISDVGVQADVAEAAGIDRAEFERRLVDDYEAAKTAVIAEFEQAQQAGITGIPSVVVDGRYLVSGAVDVEHYIRVVEHVEAERAGEASSPE